MLIEQEGQARKTPNRRLCFFDFAGATVRGLALGMPVVYLGDTPGLTVLAVIGRRQVRG